VRRDVSCCNMLAFVLTALVLLGVVAGGCRDRAHDFNEQQLLLWRAYCTNDIRGAEAALENYEELVRRSRSGYTSSVGWSNELGLIQARRSVIHSRLGDQNGAERLMEQALLLLRGTNVTRERVIADIERLDTVGHVRWRRDGN
jgi:hypothetical protein